ncbi:hypothetical protein COJ50_21660 [Bacillus cereus]|uniref:Uncharacterized protein n=1 Tax=Bacillus cereus TaxID=1396 RepID=A0A2B1K6A3_BACCE|nr:hypothetical protein COJ50_21660 [Bacillus cereus]
MGSEASKNLGSGSSTLHKDLLSFEESRYHFKCGSNNSRIFYHKDIAAMDSCSGFRTEEIVLEFPVW